MNVNRSNQINGYHRNNQIKKQNMKLLEPKKRGGHRREWVLEPSGEGARTSGHAPAPGPVEGEWTPKNTAGTRAAEEGAGTSGRTSTRAGGGRADTGAHGRYQSHRGGSRDAEAHRHRGRRRRESTRAPGYQGRRGEGARAPTTETLAVVGWGTVAETVAARGNDDA